MRKISVTFFSLVVLLVSACSAQADAMAKPTVDTMAKPTDAMMSTSAPTADGMMKPTSDSMMVQTTVTTDAMMKPTQGAMMSNETPTADGMMKATPEAMMANVTPTGDAMMNSTPDSMMAPKWVDAALKDVNSGQSFKISDYKGKVVVVELMAAWCTTCLQQEKTIQPLLNGSGLSFEYVSLDIDANENDVVLGKYAQQNQFQWKLAVASRDTAHEIGQLYGANYLNPPSAPILVVDKNGTVHPLNLGLKSADAFKTAIEALAGM